MSNTEYTFFLQDDLTCPVCRGLYTDPVSLTCGHSFCKECVNSCWQQVERCPVCKKDCVGEVPIANRALSCACESFQKEKGWREPTVPSSEDHCNLHRMDLNLFCIQEEEPVCIECVPLHRNHELLPLHKGALFCKGNLNSKVNLLEGKVELYKKTRDSFVNTVEFIKRQSQEAEHLIKAEFERLHNVLNVEEALRLKALADEERDKSFTLESKISTLTEELATLTDLVQNLKREMESEDFAFLKNFQNLKRKAQWPNRGPEYPKDCLLNMGKHVGSLGFNIWKSMQSHVSCFPVVLDPNTTSPRLTLNPQLTSIQESPDSFRFFPNNSERFDPCLFVLGAEGFTSGKHRWDVLVGKNPEWVLGVCKETVARKKKFTVSSERGIWTIGLSKGVYTALTPKRTVLAVDGQPEKIRVKLNMLKGEVSFMDGDGKHLCTFTPKFDGKIFPIFGPGHHCTPMTLAPAKVTVHIS